MNQMANTIMKSSRAIGIHAVACRIPPKRTLTALGTAIGLLFLSLGMNSYAQTNVTPAQYLALQQKPNFAASYHLPHLSVCMYYPYSDTCIEIAKDWGYALYAGTGSYNNNFSTDLANTNSTLWIAIRLAHSDPTHYQLQLNINQRYMNPAATGYPTNIGVWTTNSAGLLVAPYGTNTFSDPNYLSTSNILSPEGDDNYWSNAAAWWVAPIATIASNAPIAIVENEGEYGLGHFGSGRSQAWCQDPRVQADTNSSPWNTYIGGNGDYSTNGWLLWFNYSSYRFAHQYQFTTDAIRALLPNRDLYILYGPDGESYRYLNIGGTGTGNGTNWATPGAFNGYYTRSLSDYPNFESYYNHFNTGFVGVNSLGNGSNEDMLTKYLNAVGAFITYGPTTNYSWVSGGYTTNNFGNITNYTGLLKCYYTAGMMGGVASYFNADQTENPFSPTNPPQWLLQIMALGHVHALFSHIDNFIWNGDLLPGSGIHISSTDQPAYEFTNTTADATARVLARKLRGQNQWIVTAWAADGTNRNVTVSIPTVGVLTVLAANSGSVYQVTMSGTNVQQTLLDEYASFPPLAPPTNVRVLSK